MGRVKDLLATVYGGGEEAVDAACRLAAIARWTPVSEGLPDNFMPVLANYRSGVKIASTCEVNGSKAWVCEGRETWSPSHWMPLPEEP